MICPACRAPLVVVETRGIEVDVCAAGHGTWFDADELGFLLDDAGAPEALAGLEREVRELPEALGGTRRRCPRCARRMAPVSVPGAEDLLLDRCVRGDGLWFDPGELERLLRSRATEGHPALARVAAFLGEYRRSAGADQP